MHFNKLILGSRYGVAGVNRKGKRQERAKNEVKNELVKSLMEGDIVENEELNERAKNVTNYEKDIPVVKDYELLINSKKKGILNVVYR